MEIPIFAIKKVKDSHKVERISQVDMPAIEQDFIALSKKENLIKFDAVKKQLTGPVMIPEMLIARSATETLPEHYVYFDSETIKDYMYDFVKSKNTDQSNLNHGKEKILGSYVENWLIMDSTIDKASKLGYNLPAGTWMTTFSPDNFSDITEEFLENYKGFSVEVKGDKILDNNFKINMNIKEQLSKFFLGSETEKFTLYKLLETEQFIHVDNTSKTATKLNADKTLGEKLYSGVYSVEGGSLIVNWETSIFVPGSSNLSMALQSLIKMQQVVAGEKTINIDENGKCNYVLGLGKDVPDGSYTLDNGNMLVITDGVGKIFGEVAPETAQQVTDVIQEATDLRAEVLTLKSENLKALEVIKKLSEATELPEAITFKNEISNLTGVQASLEKYRNKKIIK